VLESSKCYEMNVTNARRQVNEIQSLQNSWYGHAIKVTTPGLYNKLQKLLSNTSASSKGTIKVKKNLAFQFDCTIVHPEDLPDVVIEFTYPCSYPENQLCTVNVINSRTSEPYTSCTTLVNTYLQSFLGSESVQIVLEWLSENKKTCLLEVSNGESNGETKQNSSPKNGQVECYVLRYNHLLSGSEHKKEKQMIDVAKKSRLQGGILWGTPGIVVIVPESTEEDAKEYASECRAIGKRADGVEIFWFSKDEIDAVGMGGIAQKKRGNKLLELTTSSLRIVCGGVEEVLRQVLGVA
jgi:hypothetical protein